MHSTCPAARDHVGTGGTSPPTVLHSTVAAGATLDRTTYVSRSKNRLRSNFGWMPLDTSYLISIYVPEVEVIVGTPPKLLHVERAELLRTRHKHDPHYAVERDLLSWALTVVAARGRFLWCL